MKKAVLKPFFLLFVVLASAQSEFVTTWKTDNPGVSEDNQVTISTFPSEIYDYTIDWGDGSTDNNVTGNITHTYASLGTYEVSITGTFPRIYFNREGDKDKIISVNQWGNINWTNMQAAFSGCSNLDVVAIDIPNLSEVTDVGGMFAFCSTLVGNVSFSNWDLSQVHNTSDMFFKAPLFNQDIGLWNMGQVTGMAGMFRDAISFNQDIGNWDVSKAVTMFAMFAGAKSFNQYIGDWNVGQVKNFGAMFQQATSFNQDISGWDVSQANSMWGTFDAAKSFDQPLNSWDVSNVTDMFGMFADASSFNQPLNEWDVGSVEEMTNLFLRATTFDQDISNWDVSNVTNMIDFFKGAGLSLVNYDRLLNGWSSLSSLKNAVRFDAGNSHYCSSSDARQILIENYGWIISDNGKNCQFVTTWKTYNPGTSGSNQIEIPTFPGEDYDYTIAWGDGTSDSNVSGTITHTYSHSGVYEISITGDFPRIYFNANNSLIENDRQKLISINQWGDIRWSSMEGAFSGCTNLNVNATDIPDLTNVTLTNSMFKYCSSLRGNTSIGDWDVSNISDMSDMFNGTTLFNQNINNWDVGQVTNMEQMFREARSFNQDLNNWDVSNVTNMKSMFYYAEIFNKEIGGWEVGNVEDMSGMFSYASMFDQNIGGWDISNVNNLGSMFAQARAFNQNIGSWDVSNVTNMGVLFSNARNFNQDISGWNVSMVTSMRAMFNGTHAFNQDISSWDVSNVTIMDAMFQGTVVFDQDIGVWDVSKVTDMDYMFNQAGAFEQDISDWDVSKVESMIEMFKGTALTTANYDKLLIGWSGLPSLQRNVTFNGGHSQFCLGDRERQNLIDTYNWTITDANQNCRQEPFITVWKTDNPGGTNANQIRIPAHPDENYDYFVDWGDGSTDQRVRGTIIHTYDKPGTYTVSISGEFPRIYFNGSWDSDKLLSIEQWGSNPWSSMENAFSKCRNLDIKTNDIPDLRLVKDFSYAFVQCHSLIGNSSFEKWDVSEATNMTGCFKEATIFNQNIGDWDVSNVTEMISMFADADSFNQDIGDWDVSSVQNMRAIFSETKSFNQDIGNWDVGQVTNMMHAFYRTENFNQDISNWDIGSVVYISYMLFEAKAFNQPIGKWDTSNLTDVQHLLTGASSFNQTLSNWNITNIDRMDYLLYGTGLSTANYDDTLIGWNNQSPVQLVRFQAYGHKFCMAEQARQNLIDKHGWVIEDDGKDCSASLFTTTWKTDNPGASEDNQITIPTFPGESYNYTVDWGDGNSDTNVLGDIMHTYATQGTYQVSISGNFSRIYFNFEGDKDKIISVDNWGDIEWSSMEGAFAGCTNLEVNATDIPNFNQLNSLATMFADCKTLTGNNTMNYWNLHTVTSLSNMFRGTSNFNTNLENWYTGNVADVHAMFKGASLFNQAIGTWDVARVTNMTQMFTGANEFNQDIGNWNVSKVTEMDAMFSGASSFNQDIGNWDVSNVINMNVMFALSSFNQDISNWDVSKVINLGGMFFGNPSFNQDIGNWDVSNVEDTNSMFEEAIGFDKDLGNWDIGKVQDMSGMFRACKLSQENYDKTLKGWGNLPFLQNNVTFDAGSSQYCEGTDARQFILDTYGWIITDDGKVPYCNEDNDADGVLDHLDKCLNSADGSVVDANGCEIVASDAISIYGQTPTCVNEANGSIEISSKLTDRSFDISITGTEVNTTYTNESLDQPLMIGNLPSGLYTITIEIPDALYKQTFGVTINKVNSVTGKRQSIDTKNKTATYLVSGSQQYTADVNGKTEIYTFDSTESREIRLTGLSDYNSIAITGKNDCQGKVEDTFNVAGALFVYPVITRGKVFVYGVKSVSRIKVYDMAGRIIIEKNLDPETKEGINLEGYGAGMYPIKIVTDGNTNEFKVIKQ